MVTAATLATEYVDGQPRFGSHSMDAGGRFSLHRDYLADSIQVSPEAVRKLLRSLVAKRHLDRVAEGTYGRPSQFHALVVRGAKNEWVTGCGIGIPLRPGSVGRKGCGISTPYLYDARPG